VPFRKLYWKELPSRRAVRHRLPDPITRLHPSRV
jgi:hypothetical protein